jgi:hypothetical protein
MRAAELSPESDHVVDVDIVDLVEDNSAELETQGGHPGSPEPVRPPGSKCRGTYARVIQQLGKPRLSGRRARTAEQSGKQSEAGGRGGGVQPK